MISSPPQEAEQIRGKTLTPESPSPRHFPSPSNIPILEKQMDPMFNEPPLNIGTPASLQVAYQTHPQQTQTHTPSAQSSQSYYSNDQQSTPGYHNAAVQNGLGAGQAQSTTYGSGSGAQPQDTSIHNYSYNQNQAPASSYSEANSASVQDDRPTYPVSNDPNAYAAPQNPAQSSPGLIAHYQALLDSLQSPAANGSNGGPDRYLSHVPLPAPAPGQPSASSLPAAPNLPPRPPAQENSNPNQDIRSYHPHSQRPGPAQPQTLDVRAAADAQPSSRPSPSTPGFGNRQSGDGPRSETPDENSRWPPEINKLYEDFLDSERKFVTDGQWDQFPMGSRLFIGNLPTEKVTKRDIFHRFFRHGKLAQISIKQAYGFVQFLEASSCHSALQAEQGQAIRGRKMHLEVSKPQRNTKKADNHNEKNNGARRRSRSPDYSRGGSNSHPRNVDRYTGSHNPLSPRDRENRRFRDEYRHARSPSPPRGRGLRSRDRSRDRYDGRRRSRSRSPRRYRSPSPRRDSDDDLPLPHRAPHQIPDVQVLVINEGLPRDFIRWVEDSFKQQGLRIDVLILSPRLSEPAVVRRQIIEGVLAIVRLSTATLAKSKVNLQVFDRRSGNGNVQFNEYSDLDPNTAAALVLHAKQSIAQSAQVPSPATYAPNYGPPPAAIQPFTAQQQYAPQAHPNPALSSLSQLLGSMSQNNAGQQQPAQAGITPDLARLLGSISAPQAQPYQQNAGPPYQNTYTNPNFAQPAAPANPIPQHQSQTPAQPDMNEIMAQLAKYQR